MTKRPRFRQPHGGVEYLLSRILAPHASIEDAMRDLRCLYGSERLLKRDWRAIRARVATLLDSSRAEGGEEP